jgi:hypothetical protein
LVACSSVAMFLSTFRVVAGEKCPAPILRWHLKSGRTEALCKCIDGKSNLHLATGLITLLARLLIGMVDFVLDISEAEGKAGTTNPYIPKPRSEPARQDSFLMGRVGAYGVVNFRVTFINEVYIGLLSHQVTRKLSDPYTPSQPSISGCQGLFLSYVRSI